MDSASIAQQIAEYDKNKKSSADILNEAMSQYGVPEIRSRVAGLRTTLNNTENALNAVDPSVTGRTSRSLVTEAQRQRMVANERAPIAQQYGEQARALDTESSNLNEQQQAARLLAEGRINDYTVGRQALQSQYDIALARELEQRRREEADREYQLQVEAAKRAAASANRGYSLGNASSSGKAGASQRADKGFNFTDQFGNPISAASYAIATGIPFRQLLQTMANAGDAGAKQALSFVGDDFGYDPRKVNSASLANLYNNLVWGTGKSATPYTGLSVGVATPTQRIVVR